MKQRLTSISGMKSQCPLPVLIYCFATLGFCLLYFDGTHQALSSWVALFWSHGKQECQSEVTCEGLIQQGVRATREVLGTHQHLRSSV